MSQSMLPVPSRSDHPWAVATAVVHSVTNEIDNVKTLHLGFKDREIDSIFRFDPGQFNMLYLPGFGESAISISGLSNDRQTVDHTIRAAGGVTTGICKLRPGETLGLRGPFGTGWPINDCQQKDLVLVTGGIGLPPLRPVIHEVVRNRDRFGQVNLLYGARSPEALLFQNEYDSWKQSDINLQVTVDRSSPGWSGNVGVVTLLLERLESFDPGNTILLCCGPEIMMRFVARAAVDKGIPPNQVWVSTERNMNCAIGLCGHCQLGGSFVCKDGPVFRYDLIEPLMKVHGF